jgi:tRNA(His) 5'-end guanylyltransferase
MDKTSLGNRHKDNYEKRAQTYLYRRIPVLMRLDGVCFHTFTRGMERPYDYPMHTNMRETARYLCTRIQGAQLAFVQSDEITILITDFNKLTTDAWYNYNAQKMCSVAGGWASSYMSLAYGEIVALDCRVWNCPRHEVANNFVWRQKDWHRNSVQMLAQANFSHKELHKKNQPMMHDMLHEIGINWNDGESWQKNGSIVQRTEEGWTIPKETPL